MWREETTCKMSAEKGEKYSEVMSREIGLEAFNENGWVYGRM
jgi:hypothetical protein